MHNKSGVETDLVNVVFAFEVGRVVGRIAGVVNFGARRPTGRCVFYQFLVLLILKQKNTPLNIC